ncbi:GatB/YqeY domain-containing protein [Bacillus phage vB_BanS_Nate]|uniref:GatB/YqeY domain-containing protein n=1 Tax=Bacillus phage vB_BanS_Nate TaxID=2894788 RepID=A0AAE8YUJ0_9CAUD|nr:GatB/YqeY domain-containing protein [Bacillus phage vB_BanS_Nate]UGO51038.1 GatB/YqeY domain-containing protein [Bacillus phage vB_BanS_Nate]
MIKTIKADLVQAMKNKDEFKKPVLRMLLASLEQEKVKFKLSTVEDLKEAQVIDVIGRMAKALDKEIEEYEKVGREVTKQKSEKVIVQSYLPRQLNEEEIVAEIKHALSLVERGELADVNKAKGYLSQKLKGKADMKQVMVILAKSQK